MRVELALNLCVIFFPAASNCSSQFKPNSLVIMIHSSSVWDSSFWYVGSLNTLLKKCVFICHKQDDSSITNKLQLERGSACVLGVMMLIVLFVRACTSFTTVVPELEQ